MIKHFCDRCKREIFPVSERVYVNLREEDGDTPVDMKFEYELCSGCKQKLKDFLEGKDAT